MKNHIRQSDLFHCEMMTLSKHHILQTGDFISRKRHLQKDYSILLERLLSGTANPCGTRLQGIGSWIHGTHLEKSLNPEWTSTPSGDLQAKISSNESKPHLTIQFSQLVWTRPV